MCTYTNINIAKQKIGKPNSMFSKNINCNPVKHKLNRRKGINQTPLRSGY